MSYFITYREIEWRYDDPVPGVNSGQNIQDLRTARTVLQLVAHTFLYSAIGFIIDERAVTPGVPRKFSDKLASYFDGFLVMAIFVAGLTRVALTSWSYRAFYGGQISWEDYQYRLVVGREINFAWVLSTGAFTFNIGFRAASRIISLRRIDVRDSVSNMFQTNLSFIG